MLIPLGCPPHHRRRRVLLALDDVALESQLSEWALASGFLPVVARGAAALDAAANMLMDVVLLDARPDSALWRGLVGGTGTHAAPFIAVAAPRVDPSRAFAAGAVAVLHRPLDLSTLAAHVAHALPEAHEDEWVLPADEP